jgi:hypothetical protein
MAKLSISELDEPTRAVNESTPGRTAAYDAAPANVSKRPGPIKHLRLQFNWQIVRWSPELLGESAIRPGDAV